MPIGRELADGWVVVVMDAREEISSIHWAVAIWQFNTRRFAGAHFYTGSRPC
jgi:hypothetical protein